MCLSVVLLVNKFHYWLVGSKKTTYVVKPSFIPSGVQLSLYFFLSLCLYLRMVIIVALWQIFARPIIARITCGHRKLFMKYNIYTSTISPHWGPNDLSKVHLSLYVCLYIYLSGHPCHFLGIICAACNCRQCMWLQAMGSNTLSGSIICPSVHSFVHGPFVIFGFVLIFSVGVQCCDIFIVCVLDLLQIHPSLIPVNNLNSVFL